MSKPNKAKIYAWTAYMLTHEPEEMKKLLKYGTPSDELIKIAERPVELSVSGAPAKLITFPESLNKSAGQKLLFNAAKAVTEYVKTVPLQAFATFEHLQANLKTRRADTRANYLMIAEAVLHRAACEFKHEVLFSFDSINEWIKSVYSKELGYYTIRKALETLESEGYLLIKEWGIKGNRHRATKIEFLPSEGIILTYTSKFDDWLMFNDHAMNKVYTRESVTRQDVLEAKFHHYADQVLAEEAKAWPELRSLFGKADEVVTEEVIVEQNGVWTDEYIDRLLGGLVPAMQENGSNNRKSNRRIRGFDFTKSRL